ncbi:MAG: carbohydrate-binding family 9-like protein [Acidobacteria bacterium]|nr:carbohydrate-binding family 9-like protein [Acidobacteriota bacterium]
MVLLILVFAAGALGQPNEPLRQAGPVPRYEVKRASGRIVVDGKLEDAAWQQANTLTFQFPWEGQTGARQKTAARLLWDDQFLYVGYDCEDSDITAQYTQRDDPTYQDDAVELFINPNPSQVFYYGLEMNARATLYDYFYAFPKLLIKRLDFTGVQLATNLRGTLNTGGAKDAGWSLELAIPWPNFEELTKKLPPEAGSSWTANLNRWDGVQPHRRLSLWSDSALVRPSPHNPARFGKLVFVK